MNTFKKLNLDNNIIEGLAKQNILEPTNIQKESIPYILSNNDLIGESCTGSGKTLAYLLPIIQRIDLSKKDIQVIIIAPTHELVMQINAQIKLLSANSNINLSSQTIIGDVNIDKQIKKLKEKKPQIIVGTIGRVLDLSNKKKLKVHTVKTLVLDEVDALLDNTSSKMVKDLIKRLMRDTQIIMFSATINQSTLNKAKELLKTPVIIKSKHDYSINPNIEHLYIKVDKRDKLETLRKLLAATTPTKALVFINRNYDINIVKENLEYHNKKVFTLHKGISKEQRETAINNFRNGKINVLISSDLSARGLDINDITHIINLDCPSSPDEYLHRSGRTARANNKGTTISIVDSKEVSYIKGYAKKLGILINEATVRFGKLNK